VVKRPETPPSPSSPSSSSVSQKTKEKKPKRRLSPPKRETHVVETQTSMIRETPDIVAPLAIRDEYTVMTGQSQISEESEEEEEGKCKFDNYRCYINTCTLTIFQAHFKVKLYQRVYDKKSFVIIKHRPFNVKGYRNKIRVETDRALQILENWDMKGLKNICVCLFINESG
jgi:hypothetical protein